MQEAAAAAAPETPTAEVDNTLSVIGSQLEALADIAPTLKEAELRILIELARRQEREKRPTRASSETIAKWCKLSRSKTVPALHALAARSLITTRAGTASRPAIHHVNIFETAKMTRPFRGQVAAEDPSPKGTAPLPFGDTTRPEGGQVPTENTQLTKIAAASDFDAATLHLLARVFSSKPEDFDSADLAEYRGHLYGLFSRFGRDDNNRPFTSATLPLYPTDHLVANFLACGDERGRQRLLQDLLHECQAGAHPMYSYMYFVYVALARLQRIKVEQTKLGRAILRDVKRGKTTPKMELQDTLFSTNLIQQAVAGSKKLR